MEEGVGEGVRGEGEDVRGAFCLDEREERGQSSILEAKRGRQDGKEMKTPLVYSKFTYIYTCIQVLVEGSVYI